MGGVTDSPFEDGLVKGADRTDGTNAAEGLDDRAYEEILGVVDDPGEWGNVTRFSSQNEVKFEGKTEPLELLEKVHAGLAEIAQGLENIKENLATYKVVGECLDIVRRVSGHCPASGDVRDVYALALDPAFEPHGYKPVCQG